jgi:geranylgeranyl pyrophosphate synthase
VLKTLEPASADDRAELAKWMQTGAEKPTEKVAAVRAIFDRNDIPALISEEKKRFQREAFRHLDALKVPAARKMILRETVENLLERES